MGFLQKGGARVHITLQVYKNRSIYRAGAEPFKQSWREGSGHIFIRTLEKKIHGHAQLIKNPSVQAGLAGQ